MKGHMKRVRWLCRPAQCHKSTWECLEEGLVILELNTLMWDSCYLLAMRGLRLARLSRGGRYWSVSPAWKAMMGLALKNDTVTMWCWWWNVEPMGR